jgi:hypothetical protein
MDEEKIKIHQPLIIKEDEKDKDFLKKVILQKPPTEFLLPTFKELYEMVK